MLTSPLPIYLGCAGLIVGSLGLGAQHMLGGSSAPVPTNAAQEQPLFARSVEEAALPATHWPSQNPEVAYLRADGGTSDDADARVAGAVGSQSRVRRQEEPPAATPREVVRDVPSRAGQTILAPRKEFPAEKRACARRTSRIRSNDDSRTRAGAQRAGVQDDAEETRRRTASFRAPLSRSGGMPSRWICGPARTAAA